MKIIETDMDLLQWVADAGPGDRCEYHRGNLAQDRWPNEKQLSALADTAYDLSKQRLVHLVQERVDEGFSYQAVSRTKPPLFAEGDK
jgi:hypothetical protein